MLISLKAGGVGLNLVSASVVWYILSMFLFIFVFALVLVLVLAFVLSLSLYRQVPSCSVRVALLLSVPLRLSFLIRGGTQL
jgi:hypothetical protein